MLSQKDRTTAARPTPDIKEVQEGNTDWWLLHIKHICTTCLRASPPRLIWLLWLHVFMLVSTALPGQREFLHEWGNSLVQTGQKHTDKRDTLKSYSKKQKKKIHFQLTTHHQWCSVERIFWIMFLSYLFSEIVLHRNQTPLS